MFIEFFLKTPVFMTIGTIDLIYSGFNSAVICLTGAKDARIGLFLLGLYSLLLSLERIGDSVNMLWIELDLSLLIVKPLLDKDCIELSLNDFFLLATIFLLFKGFTDTVYEREGGGEVKFEVLLFVTSFLGLRDCWVLVCPLLSKV